MKRFSIVLLLCVAAGFGYYYYFRKAPVVEVPQTRETIAVKYAADDIEIHESPAETAPAISKRRITEPISIVSEKEGWSEVKLSIDKFGWVASSELVADRHEIGSTKEKIRFRVPPAEVKQRGPRGSVIWLKVAVTAYGDVADVRMWQNSTGKKEMTDLHTAAVKKAKFYPMMSEGGTLAPFNYDYKVEY
ncbi:MAG: hypothetical protein HYU52_00515 [Acidobacteria bacterium]|nr:hypothetical protein [Acidobacteriota bacterium]